MKKGVKGRGRSFLAHPPCFALNLVKQRFAKPEKDEPSYYKYSIQGCPSSCAWAKGQDVPLAKGVAEAVPHPKSQNCSATEKSLRLLGELKTTILLFWYSFTYEVKLRPKRIASHTDLIGSSL